MKKSIYSILLVCVLVLGVFSCTDSNVGDDYLTEIENSRKTKDSFYKANVKSPLGKDSTFEHLNYFPVSKDWVIDCDFKLRSDTQIIIIDTKGYSREYTVYGTLTGETPTGNIELFAFKMAQEPNLFIPFMDSTSRNKKTYAGGRFIECPFPDKNMKITLDFNQAYNPYCHYNHEYNCPVVPKQNNLKNEILAGEKIYKEQKEKPVHFDNY